MRPQSCPGAWLWGIHVGGVDGWLRQGGLGPQVIPSEENLRSEVVLEVALTIRLALMTAPGGAGPHLAVDVTAEPVPPRALGTPPSSATGPSAQSPQRSPSTSRCKCHPCPPKQLPHGFTNMAHVTQVRAHATCPEPWGAPPGVIEALPLPLPGP